MVESSIAPAFGPTDMGVSPKFRSAPPRLFLMRLFVVLRINGIVRLCRIDGVGSKRGWGRWRRDMESPKRYDLATRNGRMAQRIDAIEFPPFFCPKVRKLLQIMRAGRSVNVCFGNHLGRDLNHPEFIHKDYDAPKRKRDSE